MEYADQVYNFLLSLRPGEKIDITTSKDPERFVSCVKDLMDNWNLKNIEFNGDYTILRRMNEFYQIKNQ